MSTTWAFQRVPVGHISSVERDGRWSLAMIVKDEEAVLGRVLEDVASFCDEIVVVDTGSSDASKAIATEHGARVFDFEWVDDFAAARNFSFEQCTSEWIMWLDADDRIPPDAQSGFLALKEELQRRPSVAAVMVPYRYRYASEDPDVCVETVQRERLVRRERGLRWVGRLHENILLPGGRSRSMAWPDAWVEHRPLPGHWKRVEERNLRIVDQITAAGDRTLAAKRVAARALASRHQWEDALAAYEEFVDAVDPSRTPVWLVHDALVSMAICSENLGRDDDKRRFLLRAVEVDPGRAEALVRLGVHHYERREWVEAIPFFTAATALSPPEEGIVNDEAYSWWSWDYLALCHAELGDYEAALRETEVALRTTTHRERLLANRQFFLEQIALKGGEK